MVIVGGKAVPAVSDPHVPLVLDQPLTRQLLPGRYVGCLEELGFYEGWISEEQVHAIGDELEMTLYGKYLKCL